MARMAEFRWISYECDLGHVVARGALIYRPGEEPMRLEPPRVPESCPRCGGSIYEQLRCWDDCPAPILPGVSVVEAWDAWKAGRAEEKPGR